MNKPETQTDRSVETAIGAQVKYLRGQLGVTARELADLADMSVSALSKIENGRISPSLSALSSLANALNVPLATLFSELDKDRDCSFVPSGQAMRMERRGTREGHEYDLLGQSLSGPISIEPFLITLKKGSDPYTGFRHTGIEFLFMLKGAMTYQHGGRLFDMKEGDALTFDANSSHGPAKLSKTPCQYLSVIVSQRD